MSENIKFVGYPRTGNQLLLSRIWNLCDVPEGTPYESFLYTVHDHDHDLSLDLKQPVVYICRNPLEVVYSRSMADERWHTQNKEWKKRKTILFRMQEYRDHLDKFYRSPNLIVTYKKLVNEPLQTMRQVLGFSGFKNGTIEDLKSSIEKEDKQSVIDRPINPHFYDQYLLHELYHQRRQEFIEKQKNRFLDFFKDYPELFE